MSQNDRIILDQVIDKGHQEVGQALSKSEYFEVFTAEQILKDFDLSYDEIESGITGHGGDGGIDSMYLFINGELIHEDTNLSNFKRNIKIELFIIQSKVSTGFSEFAIDRLNSVTDDLLDLSRTTEEFAVTYNEAIIQRCDLFRKVHNELGGSLPALNVAFYYATKGSEVHPNVHGKVQKLKETVKHHFSAATVSCDLLGAKELLELARRAPTTVYPLELAETPISSSGQAGFLCLVNLRDFFSFITDENGNLLRHIFESNVRDYQGRTQVNDEIQESLKRTKGEDFWWLNNGITILATRAPQTGKTLMIEDPQIVNGLQTSTEVYSYFKEHNPEKDDRKLVVRVIVPSETESWDRIIKATNSQTTVPPASLRATDKIQRDIEEYLHPRGFYYDRRKNQYKNAGKSIKDIVSIPRLAQAVMAIALQQPNIARARPSSLLRDDKDYSRLYNEDYPLELYYICAALMKSVETFLRSEEAGLERKHRNNLQFYVAMHVAATAVGSPSPTADQIAKLSIESISQEMLQGSLKAVKQEYENLGGTDQVAKGPALLNNLKGSISTLA